MTTYLALFEDEDLPLLPGLYWWYAIDLLDPILSQVSYQGLGKD